jgi:hypothetical protein
MEGERMSESKKFLQIINVINLFRFTGNILDVSTPTHSLSSEINIFGSSPFRWKSYCVSVVERRRTGRIRLVFNEEKASALFPSHVVCIVRWDFHQKRSMSLATGQGLWHVSKSKGWALLAERYFGFHVSRRFCTKARSPLSFSHSQEFLPFT